MRLLSLAPSNTEILYALGLGDEVIGVTAFCDYPIETRTKPKVGGWTTPLPEKIRTLRPDLIFTSYFLPPELRDWTGPGKIVHVIPKTLHEVYKSILEIGTKVQRYTHSTSSGPLEAAKEIVKRMKAEFAQIKEKNNLAMEQFSNHRPRVYMEEWPASAPPQRDGPASADPASQDGPQPPMVSGNWVPELVEIAGGIPAIAKTGKPSGEFPFAMLERENPDLMIFHWCGYGTRFDKKNVIDRPSWRQLRAVKNGKIFNIDDALLNRPGPRLVEGARKIQDILLSY